MVQQSTRTDVKKTPLMRRRVGHGDRRERYDLCERQTSALATKKIGASWTVGVQDIKQENARLPCWSHGRYESSAVKKTHKVGGLDNTINSKGDYRRIKGLKT